MSNHLIDLIEDFPSDVKLIIYEYLDLEYQESEYSESTESDYTYDSSEDETSTVGELCDHCDKICYDYLTCCDEECVVVCSHKCFDEIENEDSDYCDESY